MYQVILYENALDKVGTLVAGTATQDVAVEKKLGQSLNTADNFTFKLYPFNQFYRAIEGMKSYYKITSENDGEVLSRGRALYIQESYDADKGFYKTVTCAGELDYLNDSNQPFQKVQNTTPAQDFRTILAIHNQQVPKERQFQPGVIEITNSTDNVYHYVAPGTTTLKTLMDKLVNKWGGELHIRYGNDGIRYLDWLKEVGVHAKQRLAINTNLRTLERKLDPSAVFSVFYPYGATIESDNQEGGTDVSNPRLTIAKVNSDKDYLERQDLIEQYGRISGTNTWDDVKVDTILLSKAKSYFADYKPVAVGYQVKAVDLKPLGLAVDSLELGNYHWLDNQVMGIDDELRIISRTLDLDDPGNDSLTIGDKELTLADYNKEQREAARSYKELSTSVANNTNSIGMVSEQTEQALKDVAAANETIKKIQKDIENADLAGINANLGTLSQQLTTLGTSIKNLDIKTETLEQKVATILQDTSGLKEFQTSQLSTNESIQSSLAALEIRVTALEGRTNK